MLWLLSVTAAAVPLLSTGELKIDFQECHALKARQLAVNNACAW